MNSTKPKEPLVGVLLSILFPGLGQFYAGRVWRGLLFLFVTLTGWTILLDYVCDPTTKLHLRHLFAAFVFIWFSLFVVVDSYRCTEEWNFDRHLPRKLTAGKKILLTMGILFFIFMLNPLAILYYSIRTNIVQSFIAPSESMRPTLMEGDRFLVNKVIYKKSDPKRGDVIVFQYPEDPQQIFIQRIAGLPGEPIEIRDNHLLINGSPLKEAGRLTELPYFNEGEYGKKGQVVKIPAGSYYVLGDNSSVSRDSRVLGFVPKKNVIGKAYKIYYPFKRSGPIK